MTATPSDPSEPTTEAQSDAATPEAQAQGTDQGGPSPDAPAAPTPEGAAPTAEMPEAPAEPTPAEAEVVEEEAAATGAGEQSSEAQPPAEEEQAVAAAEAEVVTAEGIEGQAVADAAAEPQPSAESQAQAGEPIGEGQPADEKADEKADQKADQKAAEKQKQKKKPTGPDPAAIVKRIGTTSEEALAYVANPDQKLARMARKHREAVISEIPPVTAGALLGPEALCRHFLASAAAGRYLDLFHLWELFKAFPEDCKPVLASRQKAQEKARAKMRTATHLGLLGHAERVADDIDRAAGLPWRWLKEILEPLGPAINQRPVVLAAMIRKDSSFVVDIPAEPSDRWLAEAAALRESDREVPAEIDAQLAKYADRLPATLSTLTMAHSKYPDRVPALIDRVDLDAPDISAILAWARDHGHHDQLVGRIAADVEAAAGRSRAEGLARWRSWRERGVEVPMPESVAIPTLEGLDLGRPESADLIKLLVDRGADLHPQQILDTVASENRMLGEKAYEAFVCAGFDGIHLPLALEGNPMVRSETRCPACQAWTWVRPGHEQRCPHDGMPPGSGGEDAEATVDAAVATFGSAEGAPAPVSPSLPGGARPDAPPGAPAGPRPASTPEGASPTPPEPVQADLAPDGRADVSTDTAEGPTTGASDWTAAAEDERDADRASGQGEGPAPTDQP